VAGAEDSLLARMRRDAARQWLNGTAVLVGVAVLAGGLVWQGERAAAQQRAATQWYEHTLEVQAEVSGFSCALSEIQRAARGYLLTGDPVFLSSYLAGLREAPINLRRVQALTIDNPGQQRRLVVLASETKSALDLSRDMVRLEAVGRHQAALALVRGGGPHAAMERARAVSAAMVADEQRLRAVRAAAATRAAARLARIGVALACMGVGLLGVAGALGWVATTAETRARLADVRAKAFAQTAASATLLAQFVEEAPAAIAMFDRQMRYMAASRRYAADYALPAGIELVGRSHYEIFPEVPQCWRDIHQRVLGGETQSCECDPFPRADGRTDWVRWRMEPWRDAEGGIAGALLFSEVITAQVESQRAQLSAEARLRAIVETAVDAIVVIDEAGIVQSANAATRRMFGYGVDELVGRNVSLLMAEPERSEHDDRLRAYLATGERKIIGTGREVEGRCKDGSRVPIDLAVAEWCVEGRRFFTGLMRDASARKAAEAQRSQAERRELVVGELRHRITNMFSVIQSLVTATARSHRDVAAYRDALRGRISAFAATQVELARQGWSSLGLRELVDFELAPYAEAGGRVSIQGEAVQLNGAAASSLAMVLHELATNAAKYGALSVPGAALDIRWRLAGDGATDRRLILDWSERDGPAAAAPQRRGFGSTVIQSSARALGGSAHLDFAPEGLCCRIEMPVSRVLAAD
jgi:PAS domain S-box-containing protein